MALSASTVFCPNFVDQFRYFFFIYEGLGLLLQKMSIAGIETTICILISKRTVALLFFLYLIQLLTGFKVLFREREPQSILTEIVCDAHSLLYQKDLFHPCAQYTPVNRKSFEFYCLYILPSEPSHLKVYIDQLVSPHARGMYTDFIHLVS